MSHNESQHHRSLLIEIARKDMLERGLDPDFSTEVMEEVRRIADSVPKADSSVRDLRHLLWCSIDNDDSLDLDQLTVAEPMSEERIRVMVAIADVDAVVKQNTAIDKHAAQNTTSVYTAAAVFPMLPDELSTGLTSLNEDSDRMAIVVEMVIDRDGVIQGTDIFRAQVRNRAKLAYNSLAEWLEGNGPLPGEAVGIQGLAENIKLQSEAAGRMKNYRHEQGALDFTTSQARPIFEGDTVSELRNEVKNRAKEIIEDFMIGANGVTARYLTSHNFPSFRRIVRTPKRWSRIVEIAEEDGYKLPGAPDSKSLQEFLTWSKKNDPDHIQDLSLSIIKLLGPGEYAVGMPGEPVAGHFGLAVQSYSHSTAPNRRFPDLITHRLLKAALSGKGYPYTPEELIALAAHCTEQENDAKKVERQVGKSAAALLLEHRIGEKFDAIVTGASDKGTWVRLLRVPVEGRVVEGYRGLDVGNRIRVELVDTDVWRGFIDFRRIS
jgi:VacB/RNase II family 3'-5' exoribonuclease